MTLLPLSLGVRRASDAGEAVSKQETPSKSQIEKTLARDSFTCRCCGFVSKKYQRVLPLSQVSSGKKAGGELVTVCSFCELTASLDRAGQTNAGYLIWLPELTQADLNHVLRALYVAKESGEAELSSAAARTLDVLTARRSEAKKRLGTDDPLILATALMEQTKAADYAARQDKLEGIRFLSLDRYFARMRGKDTNVFPQMVSYWASPEGAFGKRPVAEWITLFNDVAAKATA